MENTMAPKPVILASSSLILNEGEFVAEVITEAEAKELVGDSPINSTIANRDMSQFLSTMLGREVWPSNRTVSHHVGQYLISCRPRARRRRGEMLTAEELKMSGVDYMLIERVA